MKNYGIVHGGAEQAIPLVVGKDTVYVHTNITKLEPDPNDEFAPADLYSYEEIQYDKDDVLESQLTDTQIALADIFEQVLAVS